MNKWVWFIWLGILCFPFFLNGQGISLDLLNDTIWNTDPGKLISIPFRITNKNKVSARVMPYVEMPEDWKEVSISKKILLLPESEQIALLSFTVPRNCIAGMHTIRYTLNNENGEKYVREVYLDVNRVSNLLLSLADSDSYVRAGSAVNSRFLLTNKSNYALEVELESSGSVIGQNAFVLRPDSSRIILVKTITSVELLKSEQKGIMLTARVKNGDNLSVTQFHRALVIPTSEPKVDKYQRFDVKASLTHLTRILGDDLQTGFQGELFGFGNMDTKGKHTLEFRLRGPDRFQFSVLGQHDEYYLKYTNPSVQVILGDHNYALTPLTENSRYGKGSRIDVTGKYIESGIYYNQPRFSPGLSDVFGANLNVKFDPEKKLGINFLNKSLKNDPEPASILSLSTGLQFFENTHLYAEFSRGWKGKNAGNGCHVAFDTRNDRFYLSTYVIFADKNFPGYYTNTTTLTANASYRVYKSLSFFGSAWKDDKNTTRDTLYGISPYRIDYRAGIGVNIGEEGQLRFLTAYTLSEDRAEVSMFHYRKNYFRLEYNQLFNKIYYFHLNGDYGKTKNLLNLEPESEEANGYRIQANFAYTPYKKFRAGTFVAYERDVKYSMELESGWYYGLDLTSWLGKGTMFNFRFQNNYALEEYYRNRSLMDLRVTQKIGKNHEITVLGQYAILQQSTEKTDLSIGISYSVDLGIPIRKTVKPGQNVSGRLLNEGVETIAGVTLLLNGYKTETDLNGNFEFKNLPPGSYMLAMDIRSVKFGDIANVRLPLKLTIEPGTDSFVTFGLTRACYVKGKLKFKQESANEQVHPVSSIPEPVKTPQIGGIIIEAKMGNEIIRLLSDNFGIFEFAYLRPGLWDIKIYENGLSRDFELQQSAFQFDLKPGDEIEFDVEIKAKRRSIRYIEPPVMQSISMHK